MRLFFVNRFFYPDESATSALLSDLTFSLSEEGLEIHVLTSRSHYTSPTGRLEALDVINGVTVHRLPTLRTGNKSLLGRIFNFFSFYFF